MSRWVCSRGARQIAGWGVLLILVCTALALWAVGATMVGFHLYRRAALSAAEQPAVAHLRMLQAAVEQSANIVIITDAGGTIEYVNQSFVDVTGWQREEAVGKNPRILKADLVSDETYRLLWETITAGQSWCGEIQQKRRDDTLYWASLTISGVRNLQGEITHFIGVQEVITQRKEAEEALESKVSELDAFAYAVAHDLKSPLIAIERLSGWLSEDIASSLGERQTWMLEKLNQRAHRMRLLVEGILRYARLGRDEEPIEAIDTKAMLAEIVETLQPRPGIVVKVEDNLPVLQGRRLNFSQVFSNLLDNAIKYHDRPNGNVTVGCDESTSHFTFRVADDGPGIHPRYREKIFEFLQTLHLRDEIDSTGIGLALVRKMLNAEGGSVDLEANEGRGATFVVRLPKRQQEHSVTLHG